MTQLQVRSRAEVIDDSATVGASIWAWPTRMPVVGASAPDLVLLRHQS